MLHLLACYLVFSQVDQSSDDIDQSLEMALLNFSKEANKQKGRVEVAYFHTLKLASSVLLAEAI